MFDTLSFLAILPITIGGNLLITARRSRGGTDPHCLMCGNKLAGFESTICPQCGYRLVPGAITKGPPTEMKWGQFLIGLMLVLGPTIWVVARYFASAPE